MVDTTDMPDLMPMDTEATDTHTGDKSYTPCKNSTKQKLMTYSFTKQMGTDNCHKRMLFALSFCSVLFLQSLQEQYKAEAQSKQHPFMTIISSLQKLRIPILGISLTIIARTVQSRSS